MKIVILTLLLATSVCGQAPAASSGQLPLVRVDRIGEATKLSFFSFSTSIRKYLIRHDGWCETSTFTNMRKHFPLIMGGKARLEQVYFAEFEGDLLLEYEVGDGSSFRGYVMRLDQQTRKIRWITSVSATSLGPGLIDDLDLYIGGANFVAKIDLRNGDFLWQQSQLENFYSFSAPWIKGDNILFRDEWKRNRTLEVEKQTGRLIKP